MQISYDAERRTVTVEASSRLGFEAVGLLSCRDLRQPGFRAPDTVYWQQCTAEPGFGVCAIRRGGEVRIIRAVAWALEPERSVAEAVDEILRAIGNALRVGAAQLAADHAAAAAGIPGVQPQPEVPLPAHLEQLEAVWPGAGPLEPRSVKL